RNPEKTLPFSRAGAWAAKSPREAASRAEILISMVADDLASRDVDGREWRTSWSQTRCGADRIQHAQRGLGKRVGGRGLALRLRVSRCSGHRYETSRRFRRTDISGRWPHECTWVSAACWFYHQT